jgi:hypothetical protein
MSQDYYNQQQYPQQPYQQMPAGYGGAPVGYGMPAAAYGPPPRPGSVTGLAVVSLILSLLMLSCVGIGYAATGTMSSSERARYEQRYPDMANWDAISLPLKGLAAVGMLTASIAMFSLQKWSRALLILSICINLIVMSIAGYYVMQMAGDVPRGNNSSAAYQSGYKAGFAIGAFFGPILSLIHLIWAASVFNSPRVKRAFNKEPEPTPSGYAAQYPAAGYGYPPQGYPPQGYPQHGYPQQGYPQQGYQQQNYPYDPNQPR